MLSLFNSLTRKIEKFKPLRPPRVGMYTCGPTVYDFNHIGHFRTYVNTDILRRVLEFNGFNVKQVMNITDVGHLTSDADFGEDKMELAARRQKKSAWGIAKFYEEDFWQAMAKLNVEKPAIVCRATEHIDLMIKLIQNLGKKGFTYKIADGIYFDTARFPNYGILTKQKRTQLKPGARVEMVPGKRHPTDFALWKFTPKGVRRQMEWDSPWAPPGVRGKVRGFPGWHIECSAMSLHYLGDGERSRTIDIHTGGADHIPIHHTNEIAQSEAFTGKPFVKYWFHNEFLLVEGQKMSKSLHNIFNTHDVLKRGFNLLSLRYLFLTSRYRTQMNFTWEALAAAKEALNNLYNEIRDWEKPKIGCAEFEEKFLAAVNDDLNMPQALAVVWELVKGDYPTAARAESLLKFDQVLGLDFAKYLGKKVTVPTKVEKLLAQREKLRQAGKWSAADKIRKELESLGFLVEDTPQGPKVKTTP